MRSESPACCLVDGKMSLATMLCGDSLIEPARERLVVLGVGDTAERAEILAAGIADALAGDIALDELDRRCVRLAGSPALLPRWRDIGWLRLDLFHRDAQAGGRWLGLHPREFALLWRLSERPGRRFTRQELLRDVWRLNHLPETNSLEVHISRLRAKLAHSGHGGLVETDPDGGYRLCRSASAFFRTARGNTLDSHVRMPDDGAKAAVPEKG